MPTKRLAVLDQYANVLQEYSDKELNEVCRVANAPEGSEDRIGDSNNLESYQYKEAQIHGEVDLSKHVQRLVVHPKHRVDGFPEDRLRIICENKGIEFIWMDEEKKRRMYEERISKEGKALEAQYFNKAEKDPRRKQTKLKTAATFFSGMMSPVGSSR